MSSYGKEIFWRHYAPDFEMIGKILPIVIITIVTAFLCGIAFIKLLEAAKRWDDRRKERRRRKKQEKDFPSF